MRCLLTIYLALLNTPAFAQDNDREVPLPFVTLVPPPEVPKLAVTPIAKEQLTKIEQLIGDFSGIAKDDLFLNCPYRGPKFVPVGEYSEFGHWTGKRVEVSNPIRNLVEIGPEALPYLLASLDDDTPTGIVIQTAQRAPAIAGGMAFDEILHGNPVNPTERFILSLNRTPYSASIHEKDRFDVSPEVESYRVKIGDVCFVMIGQIVGREYVCLASPHVKSSGILIMSPVHRKSVRERVREIWASKHPRQKLLESLVLDFSTRDLHANSPDFWDLGNEFQIASAKRLLYYYPDIAVPLVVDRIKGLHVSGNYSDDCDRNGLRLDYFVDAIAWSDNVEIRAALAGLARRTKEPRLLRALERAGVDLLPTPREKK